MSALFRELMRLIGLLIVCTIALQLFFVARIACMRFVAPESTSFQRSEIWRLMVEKHEVAWSQQWVPDARISANLKRAVIASEDAGFTEHGGVEWDAIERARDRNLKAEARIAHALTRRKDGRRPPEPKVIGGSTITQQLAKNLFLSGERTLVRKGQEMALTYALETLLGKRRILEIYLNHVEWGEGVFGAQAAARHYFRVDAQQLTPYPAARLAVMLPAPKRFEQRPTSPYVLSRSGTVVARMGGVVLP